MRVCDGKSAGKTAGEEGAGPRTRRHPAGAGHPRADRGRPGEAGPAACWPTSCSPRASTCGSAARPIACARASCRGPTRLPPSSAICTCTPSTFPRARCWRPGCVYIVPLLESMALPPELAAATNPKSSTGRLDVFTRVIADGVDRLRPGPGRLSRPALRRDLPADVPHRGAQGLAADPDPVSRRPDAGRRPGAGRVASAARSWCRRIRPTSRTASPCPSISSATSARPRRLSRQAAHRRRRCRRAGRLRGARLLGADPRCADRSG